MQSHTFFPYDWKIDDRQINVTSIRIYGLDDQDKTVCARVDNFTPFVYIELPDEIEWDENTASRVSSKIDSLMGDRKPLFKSLEYRKRLYYAHLDSKGARKSFPYLFLAFATRAEIRTLSYKIRSSINVAGVGRVKLKMHEQDANEVLQLVCRRNLPTAGWIHFRGVNVGEDDRISSCDHEFMVDWKNMSTHESNKVPKPKVLSFDLEVYSSDPNTMPKTERLGDKIFQISCVIGKHGDSEDEYEKTLLTFGEPDADIVGEDTEIRMYETEDELIVGFTDFIQETQPNIIVGYNIFGFDIPYLIARATAPCMCFREFAKLGFLKDTEAKMKTIKWSSSAYGKQEFEFLDAEGRLFVDLLPLVKRDYKMDTYSLKAISTYFVGDTKDPLSAKGIFKCYDMGIKRKDDGSFGKKARKAMSIVGKYCVQDSALVLKLFEKLQTWIGLTEMAKVCIAEGTHVNTEYGSVPIETLNDLDHGDILSWNGECLTYEKQVRFLNQGIKECVQLTLENGIKLTCTPDHLLLDKNGDWCETQSLLNKRIKIGPENTYKNLQQDIKLCNGYKLTVGDITFDTSDQLDYKKSISFCKLIGYLLTDGSIYKSKDNVYSCDVFLGHPLDVEAIQKDIHLICGKTLKARKTDRVWKIQIPSTIGNEIIKLDGVITGKRVNQRETLPLFILKDNCPLPLIVSFLSGIFGGDGHTISFNGKKLGTVSFSKSNTNINHLNEFMESMQMLLNKCGINTTYITCKRSNQDNIQGIINLKTNSITTFYRTIGFAYCVSKSQRLFVGQLYYQYREEVYRQREWCVNKIQEYKHHSNEKIIDKVYKELDEQETVIHRYSIPDMTNIRWLLNPSRNREVKTDTIGSSNNSTFPSVSEFLRSIDGFKYFNKGDGNKNTVYGLSRDEIWFNTVNLKVIDIRHVGMKPVYDIEVFNNHSFVANSIIAHNCNVPIFTLYTQGQQIKVYSQVYKKCMYDGYVVEKDGYIVKENEHYTGAHVFDPVPGAYEDVIPFDFTSLYPTTIIAYNICWSTLVTDENIPDSMCHIFNWEDHIGCLVEGTNITIGEYSMKIEDLKYYHGNLLAYDDEKQGMRYYPQTNFFNQGIKDCVKLTMEDGTTLSCTPDHKILLSDNTWVEAQNIKINSDRVSTAYSPPMYNIGDEEFVVGDFHFTGSRLIKFYKILGVLCTDGHTCHNRTIVYCGHQMDLQNLVRDIEDLHPGSTSVRNMNYGWSVSILGKLGEIFRNLDGMIWGSKVNQTRTLPTLLEQASQGELCAFLSGLFGGDGHVFSYSEKTQSLGTLALSWTSRNPEQLQHSVSQLQKYLNICGISTSSKRLKDETYIWIKTQDILIFKEKIGFSYCAYKSMRLEARYSYLRLRNEVWNQQKWLVNRVKTLKNNMSFNDSLSQAITELQIRFPIYNQYYSTPSASQMTDLLRPMKKWEKPMFSYNHFPKALDYIESIGGSSLFNSYAIDSNAKILPRLYKKIIKIENIGRRQVYDLQVDSSHSFVADGVVVHNCTHDTTVRKTRPKYIMCEKRYYRFLKEPMGILPQLLTNLLDARKKTKKEMKEIKTKLSSTTDQTERTALDTLITVLNKRQLAFKVSANSAYGAMGVQRGYLPFMPGAMATTARGRENIEKVAEYIPKHHKGQLIYGDTDSCYIHFPHMVGKSAQELWEYSEMVAEDTSKLFPKPMGLAFEEIIYRKFFIITKKRYMSLACGKDGIVSDKIEKKGVILARRDNAKIVRDIYAENMLKVFHKVPEKDVQYDLIQTLNKMFSKGFEYIDFVITKSVKGCNELKLEDVQDEPCLDRMGNCKKDKDGQLMYRRTGRVGDYKIALWRSDEEKQRKFKTKCVTRAKDYYLKCLPAQVQLAEKMRRRGKPVSEGTRLEYVMLTDGSVKNIKEKKYEKIESADYYKDHSHILMIDYMCYIASLASSLDQVLNVVHNKQDFVLEQFKIRMNKMKVLEELTELVKPKVELIQGLVFIE